MQNFFKIARNTVFAAALIMPVCALAEIPPVSNSGSVPSLAPMLKNVMPSIVNIAVQGTIPGRANPFANEDNYNANGKKRKHRSQSADSNSPQQFQAVGSGIIVNAEKGYIITNAHVLREAKSITVTLKDGRQYKAKLIGKDTGSDIAVLQIHADHLHALSFANSNNVRVGDYVVAIGSPFGLSQTVTSGIVSALQRTNLGIEGYENFIQTDAPINPGNSGGALVNLKGQLIGINTAILAPDGGNIGIGFAIPSDMAKSVMLQIIKYGSVRRGLMGIMVQNLTPNLAQAFDESNVKGGVVTQVGQNSPASKAGFKPGDIIVEVNGQPVTSAADITNIVSLLRVGSEVKVKVLRHGKAVYLSLRTASPKAYKDQSRAANPLLFGMNLQNFSQEVALHGFVQGVQVTGISQESAAWNATPAGLRPGDVILSANQQPVHDIKQLTQVAQNSKELLLNVLRGNGAIYVVVK